MSVSSTAPPSGSDGDDLNDSEGIGSDESDQEILDEIVTTDLARNIGVDPVRYWAERHPNLAEREAVLAAIVDKALRAPVMNGELYAQLISGRGNGMRLIRKIVARNPAARYEKPPLTDRDAIALVGHGRYFGPLYSMDPPLFCQCFPLGKTPPNILSPLNGLVRRLRKHRAR